MFFTYLIIAPPIDGKISSLSESDGTWLEIGETDLSQRVMESWKIEQINDKRKLRFINTFVA